MRVLTPVVLGLLLVPAMIRGAEPVAAASPDIPQTVAARCQQACERYALSPVRQPLYPKDAMPIYTAKLVATTEPPAAVLAEVNRMMDAALKDKLDPFHLHAIIHAERVGGDKWPAELRDKFRAYVNRWSFTKPAGVSLNHELMRDGSGFIAADLWPDLVDADGNDAKKIRELCKTRLMKHLNAIPREGDSEYNAPLYHGTDFMALRMLVDFSKDPALRDAARHVLETFLGDTGVHWHRGYAITSAGRAKYWGSNQVSPADPGATTVMAWMIFGGDRDSNIENVPQGFWMAYPSAWLESIEWLPRWHASLPVPRHVRETIAMASNGYKVRKEAWITDGYGLASQRTDETSPTSYLFKEGRNVLLRWVSPEPSSSFIVFQENRRRPGEKIANAFAYGENPYAQTMQHEGTVIGVYDVPPDYGFHRAIAPFTIRGAIEARIEKDGWIFAHGGTVLFAFHFLSPATWLPPDQKEHLDLYSADSPRGGWILETSPAGSFPGDTAEQQLQNFADVVLKKTRISADVNKTPVSLSYVNLKGDRLEITWKTPGTRYRGECRVNDRVIDYDKWPRLDAPGMQLSREGWPQPDQTLFKSAAPPPRKFVPAGSR